jgi:pimeloyl-ACP methyl ester carboxylesterase
MEGRLLMDRKDGYVNLDGARLYYEVAGSGPPLTLIHGFTLDSRMWDDQFEALTEDYMVIRYDIRGYGQSDLSQSDPYSRSGDLNFILSHLNLSESHILGLSMGGRIAIDFALEYPASVTSLILADSALGGYKWKEFGRSLEQLFEIASESGVEAGKQFFSSLDLFKSATQKPEVAIRLMEMLTDYSGWHFTHDDPYIQLDPPAIERLDEITVPTLVIVGELDTLDFHDISNILHDGIPNARKIILPSVGHISSMEAPEEFNRVVREFLQGL